MSDLRDENEKMSENETEIGKPDEILDIAERILEFNSQNQQGKILKILTQKQILNRLPINLL